MSTSSTLTLGTSSIVSTPSEDPSKQPAASEMELFIRLHEYAYNPSIHFPNPYVDQSKVAAVHNTDASSGKEAHPLQYSSQAMATRTTFASASSLYASSRPSVYDPSAYANAPPPPVAAPILSATSNGYRSKQGAVHALIQAPSGHPSVTFPPYYGHSTETISFDDAASLQAALSSIHRSAGKGGPRNNTSRQQEDMLLKRAKIEPLHTAEEYMHLHQGQPTDLDSQESSSLHQHSHILPRRRSQVKVACIHCKKACKKCDEMRPCGRCVRLGMKDCVDAPRKERKKAFRKEHPYERYSEAQYVEHNPQEYHHGQMMYPAQQQQQEQYMDPHSLAHQHHHHAQHLEEMEAQQQHLQHLHETSQLDHGVHHHDLMAQVSSAFYDPSIDYPAQ